MKCLLSKGNTANSRKYIKLTKTTTKHLFNYGDLILGV